MLVSLKWLRDYVDVDLPLEEFTSRMIMSGMEVEDVKVMGEQLDRVVVGRIDKLSPHTNSDHLQICMIDVGEGEPVQIVTGAQNVFEGAYVPACPDRPLRRCGARLSPAPVHCLAYDRAPAG